MHCIAEGCIKPTWHASKTRQGCSNLLRLGTDKLCADDHTYFAAAFAADGFFSTGMTNFLRSAMPWRNNLKP
jgi:hypothetical protein